MTDNDQGLAGRMRDYEAYFPSNDPTLAVYHREMTGRLQGEELRLFFMPFIQAITMNVFGETVTFELTGHRALEVHFQERARAAKPKPHPLWLQGGKPQWSQQPDRSRETDPIPPMPTAQEILRDDPEATPPWLDACSADTFLSPELFEQMLKSRVVFYPGAGIDDGEVFETFTKAHAAHCVIHADLMNGPETVQKMVNRQTPGPYTHIAGYRPLAQQVLAPNAFQALAGLELCNCNLCCDSAGSFARTPTQSGAYWDLLERESAQRPDHVAPMLRGDPPFPPHRPGAYWAILEREAGLTDDYGPSRFAFLHVQCEAVWLYWNLWARSDHQPRRAPYAILLQDHGCGGNWTSFGRGGALHRLVEDAGLFPEWLLVDCRNTKVWTGYESMAAPTEEQQRTLFHRSSDERVLYPRSDWITGDVLGQWST